MNNKSLAIIGGGASAVLLLAHLAQEKPVFSKIEVFDRSGTFGKGVAYSTTNMAHPLNVRAMNMSGYQDKKDDLVQWLTRNAPEYNESDFIPRMVFAKYLADLLNHAQEKLPIILTGSDVTSVSHGFDVQTGQGAAYFDEVVIATGNVRPLGVEVEQGCGIYYASPYGLDYEAIKRDGHVVIIGTGLSGVDAISGLMAAGFAGRITAISRNGWFPARHVAPQVWEPLNSELHERPPADWMKEIRHYVARAVEEGLFWQTAIDSLRAETNPIWQGMGKRQRETFLRHGLSAWNIHRHRMPPESAAMIADLKKAGRLSVVKDCVRRVHSDGSVVCKGQVIEGADAVINALGYRFDEQRRNYASSYKIGPANFGELFETTAIPEIRLQASEIARALTQ